MKPHKATIRGYSFDTTKIALPSKGTRMTVTTGQLSYERDWLQAKLDKRAPGRVVQAVASAIFTVTPGPVAGWERT